MEVRADIRQAIAQLQAIARRTSNPAGAATHLYRVAEDDFARRFASSPATRTTGEVYGGVRWERLTDAYLRRNPRRQSGKQLIDAGELRKSFKRGNPGNVAQASGDAIEFGSSLKKAHGLNRKRALVVIHAELVRNAEDAFTSYILSGKS